jgi:hypothetical protein
MYRGKVKAYMQSSEWRTRRQQWVQASRAKFGRDPRCVVCGAIWRDEKRPTDQCTLDMHHVDYKKLGGETFDDLIPMCRAHHEVLHRLIDAFPSYQRMTRREATRQIIPRLRDEVARVRAANREKVESE